MVGIQIKKLQKNTEMIIKKNNIMKNFFILSLTIVILSCGSKDVKSIEDSTNRVYYQSEKGEEYYKDIIHLKDRVTIINYTREGDLISIENRLSSDTIKKHGSSIYFYPNGNINSVQNHIFGKKNGENIYFYDNQVLRSWYRLKMVGDSQPQLNESIYTTDKNGSIDNHTSEFFTVRTTGDTIKTNDKFRFEINIASPALADSMYIVVADYDENFNIKDRRSNDTIWADSKSKYLSAYNEVLATKKGLNTIRGIIHVYKNKSYSNKEKQLYVHVFEFNYYVMWKINLRLSHQS